MIFIIIGLIILAYSLYDYKNALIVYLTYKLVLVTNITIVSVPGIPLLTVEMFLTLGFIVIFFAKGAKVQNAHMKFPYKPVFWALFLCWTISAIFSLAGFKDEVSNLVKIISEDIILIWIIWEVIETKKDFQKLYKYLTILIFISCIYGFVEYILQDNPIVMYESTLISDETRSFVGIYTNMQRGYRIQSFFGHAIGAGMTWGLYLIFTVWLRINKKNPLKGFYSKISLITACFCFPCIILTKMRSPIIFLVFASLALFNFKKKRFYVVLVGMLLVIWAVLPLILSNSDILISFFDNEAQKEIGGSSYDMRTMQITAAYDLIRNSPIVGLGSKFMNVLPKSSYSSLYGLESIWIWVITQYGIIGIITYLFYSIYSVFVIAIKYASRPILFVTLAYWITYTTTSIPGFNTYLLFLVVFYFIKTSEVYKKKSIEGKIYGLYFNRLKVYYGCIRRNKLIKKEINNKI